MHGINWTNIILCTVAVIGVVMGFIAWIYNRGKDEQQLKDAIQDNTKATLAVTEGLKEFKGIIMTELTDIKVRLAVVEKIQQQT